MFALFCIMAPAGVVAAILGTYFALHARNRAAWNAVEPVMVDRAGAYRSSQKTAGLVERIRDVPSAVQAAAIMAMFFGVMWLPSIPIVGIGVAIELDGSHGAPGLATFFGIPGIPLSIAHLVLGIRFTKRSESARGIARGVAIWALVHNFVLLVVTFLANVSGSSSKSLELMKLDAAGLVILLYATASIAYAIFALYAAKVHESLDALGRVDASPELEAAMAPIAPILPTPPVSQGQAPSWP